VQQLNGDFATDGKVTVKGLHGEGDGATLANVSISGGIGDAMVQAVDDLVGYPYGCVEQTTSKMLSSALVSKMARNGRVTGSAAKYDEFVQLGLSRLARMQRVEGGWGWWEMDGLDPWMTCMVLDAVRRLQSMGVDTRAIRTDRAIDWLQKESYREIGEPLKGYQRLAMALELAHAGHPKIALKLVKGFDKDLAGPAEWALLARTYGALKDKTGLAEATKQLHNRAIVDGSLAHWPAQGWLDADANTGLAMKALVEVAPNDPLVKQAISWTMANRRTGGWSSTYSTGQILIALESAVTAPVAQAKSLVQISLNGQPVGSVQVEPGIPSKLVSVPLRTGGNEITFHSDQPGGLYYSIKTESYGSGVVPTSDPDVKIERSYHLLKPGRLENGTRAMVPNSEAVTTVQSGEIIQCILKIDNKSPKEFVLIEDPVPSNCKVTERTNFDDDYTWAYWFSGMTILDDRVAFFTQVLPGGTKTITYFMRAEVPGVAIAPPTTVSQMYNPAKQGLSSTTQMEVKP
jgi:uncharacterized protein YfaS (alpha-2-macroglobulin family)